MFAVSTHAITARPVALRARHTAPRRAARAMTVTAAGDKDGAAVEEAEKEEAGRRNNDQHLRSTWRSGLACWRSMRKQYRSRSARTTWCLNPTAASGKTATRRKHAYPCADPLADCTSRMS